MSKQLYTADEKMRALSILTNYGIYTRPICYYISDPMVHTFNTFFRILIPYKNGSILEIKDITYWVGVLINRRLKQRKGIWFISGRDVARVHNQRYPDFMDDLAKELDQTVNFTVWSL